MGDKTGIGWTDATWNPVTGCSHVSPGCDHCYAETLSLRYGWSKLPWTPENADENVILHPERLDRPARWRKPRMIFVNSMSDLFHPNVPGEFINEVWMQMYNNPRHTFRRMSVHGHCEMDDAIRAVCGLNADHTRSELVQPCDLWALKIEAAELTRTRGANWRWEGELPNNGRLPRDLTHGVRQWSPLAPGVAERRWLLAVRVALQ